jgi:hypothetical protein
MTDQELYDELITPVSRQQRRCQERQQVKVERAELHKPKRIARRTPDPLASMYLTAQQYLMTGDRARTPTFRAVRKMARYLTSSPLHYRTPMHMRGSWRSWPRDIGRTADEAV